MYSDLLGRGVVNWNVKDFRECLPVFDMTDISDDVISDNALV